jgi:hypothetical protein
LATDISGKPIFPFFRISAFDGWLPTFRESQSFPSSEFQHLVVGYRRFGKANLSLLQNFSIWWLATDVSGKPIFPFFRIPAFDGWLPMFREASVSRLQNFSIWWLATEVSGSQSFPSSEFQHLVVGYRSFETASLPLLQKSSS